MMLKRKENNSAFFLQNNKHPNSTNSDLDSSQLTRHGGGFLFALFLWGVAAVDAFNNKPAATLEKKPIVGGFNPCEKYARQIGNLPQVGVKIKNI